MQYIHKSYPNSIRIIFTLIILLFCSFSNSVQARVLSGQDSVIICILPETGQFSTLGKKVKNAISIYLKDFQENKKNIIFIDENQDFLALTDSAFAYYKNISLIIGPVFSKNTLKLSDFLDNKKFQTKIYSLSNDFNLLKKKNIEIFGFNVRDKVAMLFGNQAFQEKGFDKIILLYNKQKLHRSFQRYFVDLAKEQVDIRPTTYPFSDVRSFSRVLKLVQTKSLNNKEYSAEEVKKTALIFLGINKQISSYLNDFLLKYRFNPEFYEFYFFSDITKYTKFSKSLMPAVNIVEYNLSDYKKFSDDYYKYYGTVPSKISLSAFDAMEASDIK